MKRVHVLAGLAILGGATSLYAANAVLLPPDKLGALVRASAPVAASIKPDAVTPGRRVRVVLASPFGPETEVAPLTPPQRRHPIKAKPVLQLAAAVPPAAAELAPLARAPKPFVMDEPRAETRLTKQVRQAHRTAPRSANIIVVEAQAAGPVRDTYVGFTESAR